MNRTIRFCIWLSCYLHTKHTQYNLQNESTSGLTKKTYRNIKGMTSKDDPHVTPLMIS